MKLKRICAVLALLVTVNLVVDPDKTANAGELVGVSTLQITSPERQSLLEVTSWYPAGAGGEAVLVGDTPLFIGVQGSRDAPIAEGTFPVVLVSLGGMRAAPGLGGWIGSRLAAQGFIALVVQPPRLRASDAHLAPAEIWLRPGDLSAVLDDLETNTSWARHIKPDRVGALGFFLGGSSVLSLVGAQLDPDRYSQSCDEGGTGLDCRWFAQNNVDLHQVDATRIARSNLDPRIKIAIAVDPELSTVFSPDSLSAITSPTAILNLGAPDTLPPGLDASVLATLIPDSRYTIMETASQFSVFNICKPAGAAILAEEGEDQAICREPGRRDRDALHTEISTTIIDILSPRLLVTE
ncbi:hypothetical protein O4H49_03080 [Kiloniella laminariae]|uniref:Dienelactone hydrolase n=1 Tax=Kiloniella laminariae TaxID=454162 RepID=A0ABT4LIC0_9PROT|nr:hypothetical protein [Kiloniella laminariae]MCZ4279747.1 hypothetical protein [Kiloniella laminariae]